MTSSFVSMPAVGPRWGVNRLNSSMAYGLENAELRKGRYARKLGASYTELKAVASKFQPPARQSNSETSRDRGNVQWHRMPSSIAPDVQVVSSVEETQKSFLVTVYVPSAAFHSKNPHLLWGVYRTSAAKWLHPQDSTPDGSRPHPGGPSAASGAMLSPLTTTRDGFQIQLRFSSAAAPLSLAFTVEDSPPQEHEGEQQSTAAGRERSVTTHHRRPFVVPVGMRQGSPLILGPTIESDSHPERGASVNFCVRSREATAMSLVLVRSGTDKFMEVALDPDINKTGDAWHVEIRGLKKVASLTYGWRADASDISRFYPGQLMLDPYCRAIHRLSLPDGCQTVAPNVARQSGRSNPNEAVLGSLSCLIDAPTATPWKPLRHDRHLPNGSLVVEIDVPSFTETVEGPSRGKLLGVLDRLDDIKSSGATHVMLAPITAFAPGDGPYERLPLSFFAVEPQLAMGSDSLAPTLELCKLVDTLTAAGLSVICQVQYGFTAEGRLNKLDPSSLLGLDPEVYYRAGGVLNCGHAVVQSLVVESLLHLAATFGFAGFCFLHAESLTFDREGTVLDAPGIAHHIATEPRLAHLAIIASPADSALLPRQGARGFPHWGIWGERPTAFGDSIVSFLGQGSGGASLSAAAAQLSGNESIFGHAPSSSGLPGTLAVARPTSAALNGVGDLERGISLCRLVDDTLWTFPPHQEAAYGCASHQDAFVRSLLVATMLSRGTPCITQDVLLEESLIRFVRHLKWVRDIAGALLQSSPSDPVPPLYCWHGSDPGLEPDWESRRADLPGGSFMGFSVTMPSRTEALFVGFNNSGGGVGVNFPSSPPSTNWHCLVDSGRPAPHDIMQFDTEILQGSEYYFQPKSSVVLFARPTA